jgi:hypothetical protein
MFYGHVLAIPVVVIDNWFGLSEVLQLSELAYKNAPDVYNNSRWLKVAI